MRSLVAIVQIPVSAGKWLAALSEGVKSDPFWGRGNASEVLSTLDGTRLDLSRLLVEIVFAIEGNSGSPRMP
ncbi:MAG: hypothetical protein AAGJ83_07715 [Planctomycetota bacterium]